MVTIILGVLAVFVLPRIDLIRGFDEAGFQNAVRATLEYARKTAVAQRRNVRVTLSGNSLTLTIDDVGPEALGAGTFPRSLPLPTPDARCTGGQVNQLCAPAGAAFTLGGPTTLDFSPLGRASAAAVYTVTNQPNITVVQETGHVY
jgi:MSHA pilin protein MshC